MKTNSFSEYDYDILRNAAVSVSAEQIDVDTLGAWFERYGDRYWNGEYYDADDGLRLFPIYDWDEENDSGDIIGYEFR